MYKKIAIIIMTLSLCYSYIFPVQANSCPASWKGVSLEGVFIADDNCPLEVEREHLTFEINDFLKEDYNTLKDFLKYDSTMKAEYTFNNPTDDEITAKLLFPLGNMPENIAYQEFDGKEWQYDLEKYNVLVNDEAIEKNIRHHYMGDGAKFDAVKALEMINGEETKESFYSYDLPVTKYIYEVDNIKYSLGDFLDVKYEVPEPTDKTKYLVPIVFNDNKINVDGYISDTIFTDEDFVIYVFGEDVEPIVDSRLYYAEEREELDTKLKVKKTERMTFSEFLDIHNDERYNVTKEDWYNSAISCFERNSCTENVIDGYEYTETNYHTKLMRWYEYEITVPAKGRIKNTVIAPIYPSYDQIEKPNRYQYTYYLSPAKEWSNFGDLTIEIKTPFHLLSSNLGDFEKTNDGYILELDGLPESEFEFEMSRTSDPDNEKTPVTINDLGYMLFWAGMILWQPIVIIALIVIVVKIYKKSKNKKSN